MSTSISESKAEYGRILAQLRAGGAIVPVGPAAPDLTVNELLVKFLAHADAYYRHPDGTPTTLRDTIFSTVPGSPAYAAKASRHTVNLPQYGMVWSFEGRNAIQSDYRITHTEAA